MFFSVAQVLFAVEVPFSAGHVIDGDFDYAYSVFSADVDGDGDLDVLGAALWANDISWWENLGGQFALATNDIAPSLVEDEMVAALLTVEITHRGRPGDTEAELVTLELLFEGIPGVPLTTAEANALIENLYVYRDDGSGVFDPADALVAAVFWLELTGGEFNLSFADGDPNVLVEFGLPRAFFVVIQATSTASSQSPNTLIVTHLVNEAINPTVSTAEDRDHDIPLMLAWTGDIPSSAVIFLPQLFTDDFESGNTLRWSSVVQ